MVKLGYSIFDGVNSALDALRSRVVVDEPKRQEEICETQGHREIFWAPYVDNTGDHPVTRLEGNCSYCGEYITRDLRPDESRQVSDLRTRNLRE